MEKNIYVIRHCEATGQAADSPLTKKGFEQAEELSIFLSNKAIDKIFSSPYLRAVQSIKPYADKNELDIECDDRLTERVLSSTYFPDWLEKLEATFYDLDLKYEGGESSKEATDRILQFINDVVKDDKENVLIVAHGGIISLLLRHFDNKFSFNQWRNLTNPDVFLLQLTEQNAVFFERIYRT